MSSKEPSLLQWLPGKNGTLPARSVASGDIKSSSDGQLVRTK